MSRCRSCRAEVTWAKHHKSGQWMPLEPAPEDATRGLFTIYQGKAFPRSAPAMFEEDLFISHFATCPQAKHWRNDENGG